MAIKPLLKSLCFSVPNSQTQSPKNNKTPISNSPSKAKSNNKAVNSKTIVAGKDLPLEGFNYTFEMKNLDDK